MDEQVTVQQEARPWYVDTLDFVVKAAATKRFSSPQLDNGTMYYIDNNGNAVPMGQPLTNGQRPGAVGLVDSRVIMLAGLALAGVLLYKLVK